VAFALFVLVVLGQELTMANMVKVLLKAGLMPLSWTQVLRPGEHSPVLAGWQADGKDAC
jgi:hypothetical protein